MEEVGAKMLVDD